MGRILYRHNSSHRVSVFSMAAMVTFAETLLGKLGFIEAKCPYCDAHLHGDPPICLNACTLPTYLTRRMERELGAIKAFLADDGSAPKA